jgi:hypothetical protein
LLVLLPFVLLAIGWGQRARAAVTWQGLWAESDTRSITLIWETGTEFDNLGFYVLRADRVAGPFSRRTGSWTLAVGDVIGSTYRWTDEDVVAGTPYYYLIESISQSNESGRHGQNDAPVCAMLGGKACKAQTEPSPTRRPSPTPTARRSGSGTSASATSRAASPTPDGPTPVVVPSGAGGNDYGGSRSAEADTPVPPRVGQSTTSSSDTKAQATSRAQRGRLVTAPARSGSAAQSTQPASGIAALGGGDGDVRTGALASAGRTSDSGARARFDDEEGGSSAESSSPWHRFGKAPDPAADVAKTSEEASLAALDTGRSSGSAGSSGSNGSNEEAVKGQGDGERDPASPANPWLLLMMGFLAIALGLRVFTLTRST